MVGNMMTDLIRKKEETLVSPAVLEGIRLHRTIDELTDTHPIFIEHKRLLYPHFRKYSPVVLDIVYDYLLENNWHHFTGIPFHEFQEEIYSTLTENIESFPPRVRPIIVGMVKGRWLDQFVSIVGMQNVFTRLERKVSFPQSFSEVTNVVAEYEEVWEKDHHRFFQEIQNQLLERGWPILRNEEIY